MEHIESFQRRDGVDIGFGIKDEMHPLDREGCVGQAGINKDFTLLQMIELASRMEPRPNIIVKGGPRAKWRLKKFQPHEIDGGIERQRWRNTSGHKMWVIKWKE